MTRSLSGGAFFSAAVLAVVALMIVPLPGAILDLLLSLNIAFGVLMLLATDGGGVYPESDYRAWMAAAGCPHERSVAIDEGWHHLIIGRKP